MLEIAETYEIDVLIGSSGSFDTLAEMICCKKGDCSSWKKQPYYDFQLHDYSEIQRIIYASTIEERLEMKGLNPMRADMIVVSDDINMSRIEKTCKRFKIFEVLFIRYVLKNNNNIT